MTLANAFRCGVIGLGCLLVSTPGCGWAYNHSDVLVLTHVNVPAGGGSAEVMFQGIAGQQLLVSLTGVVASMEPAANLAAPGGAQAAILDAATAIDGFNSAEVAITQDGTYRLIVQDGSQRGGAVTVRVEIVSNDA